jgi:hypothetical protein
VASWIPLSRIEGLSFHSGASNGLSGWDGWARISFDDAAPKHNSLWELSTKNADTGKIREDFAKRLGSSLPFGWGHDTTTFAMVTLRRVGDRTALEDELRNHPQNPWRDVQILDAPALEQWIALCPAVEHWCADYLGIGNGRFGKSLDHYWREWSESTIPAMSSDLLQAGRPDADFSKLFNPAAGHTLALKADSPQEVAAYIHAYVKNQRGADITPSLLDGALVIQDIESAHRYADLPVPPGETPLTILLPPANEVAARFTKHYVVCAVAGNDKSLNLHQLPRALRHEFSKALASSMPVLSDNADTVARNCGSSVTVWAVFNRLDNSGMGSYLPTWAQANVAAEVLPAILVGSWDENSPADKRLLEALSGMPYEQFATRMLPHMATDNPLLERTHSMLSVVAPSFAFAVHAEHLYDSLLERFAKIITEVFGSIPDQDQKLFDSDTGTIQSRDNAMCSDIARRGLAFSLLWISEFHERLDSAGVAQPWGGAEQYAKSTLSTLFKGLSSPVLSYSIGDELPLLAEAAPDEFLDALEISIAASPSNWGRMFVHRGPFTPFVHTPVLFALETLAWSPLYIDRAVEMLCKLDAVDPGGNVTNRPGNSLRQIFLPWMPNTSATVDARISIFERLVMDYPLQAWKLIIKLLPRSHDTSDPNAKPTIKDFGRSACQPTTRMESNRATSAYVSLAIAAAANKLDRQMELLPFTAHFSENHRSIFVSNFKSVAASTASNDNYQAWSELRRFIAHNRQYANTFWALPELDLRDLANIETVLRPTDVVRKNLWLFEFALPQFGGAPPTDVLLHQQVADELRVRALREIHLEKGLQGTFELLHASDAAYLVCAAFDELFADTSILGEFLQQCSAQNSSLSLQAIRDISSRRYYAKGNEWTNQAISNSKHWGWSALHTVELLVRYPDDIVTYLLVESMGSEASKHFWQLRNPFLQNAAGKTRTFAVEKLILHRRAMEGIQTSLEKYPTRLALKLVNAAVAELLSPSGVPSDTTMLAYHFENALEVLLTRPAIASEKLGRLEYLLFPLLRHYDVSNKQRTVHLILAKSPEFFVKIICDAHWPESPQFERPAQISEIEKNCARIADQILETWTLVPGTLKDGNFNFEQCTDWINIARKLGAKEDRKRQSDYEIGRILRHIPASDTDVDWPPPQLASLLQTLNSKDIESGILQSIVYSGPTVRGVLDGGAQEHSAEQLWKNRALALPAKFSKARRLCQEISRRYKLQGQAYDNDSAKTRIQLSK